MSSLSEPVQGILSPAPATAVPRVRHDFLDAARAILLTLGIPYHAAIAYTAVPSWFLLSSDKSGVLSVLAAVINSFRMPAFILVAGFFSALVLSRRSRVDWMQGRLLRLGIPFVIGMLLIAPIQSLIPVLVNSGDVAATITSPAGFRIGHLWFLPVLIILSALLASTWPQVSALTQRLPFNLYVAAAVLVLWELVVSAVDARIGLIFAGGILSIERILTLLPYFAIGVLAFQRQDVLDKFLRPTPGGSIVAAVSVILFVLTWTTPAHKMANVAAGAVSGLFAAHICLAMCRRFLNRRTAVVDYLVRNSLTIYILHHPIVIGIVALLLPVSMPPLIEWALIISGTGALCAAVCAIISAVQNFQMPASAPKGGRLGMRGDRPAEALLDIIVTLAVGLALTVGAVVWKSLPDSPSGGATDFEKRQMARKMGWR